MIQPRRTVNTSICLLVVLFINVFFAFLIADNAEAGSNSQFFRMSDRWNKRFGIGEHEKDYREEAILWRKERRAGRELGETYTGDLFQEKAAQESGFAYAIPDPIHTSTKDLMEESVKLIEIKIGQAVNIEGTNFFRYLSTSNDVIRFTLIQPDLLRITGHDIGTTYVHIWDADAKITYQIRVTRAEYRRSAAEERYIKNLSEGESFKIEYSNNRTAFYGGNSFRTLAQSDMTYIQEMRAKGDTPYGRWDSGFSLRNSDAKSTSGTLSDIDASLKGYDMGELGSMDLHFADYGISRHLLAIPSVSLRGIAVDYYHPKELQQLKIFYGRENSSPLGSLRDSFDSIDSFLGGVIYDWKYSDNLNWTFAYGQGYGQNRREELNDNVMEFRQTFKITNELSLDTVIAYDDAHFAHKHALNMRFPDYRLKVGYRDISKNFYTLTGTPAFQGEQGVEFQALMNPWENIDADYNLNIFRDRIFPLIGEEDRYNVNQSGNINYYLNPKTNVNFNFRTVEETARLSPYRSKEFGARWNQGFDLGEYPVSYYVGLLDRNSESLTSNALNYRSDQLVVGAQTLLPWNIRCFFEQEVSLVEETDARVLSHPRVTTYGVSQNRQIGETPFYSNWSLRYRDEEETEADRSFLSGEDRLELSGKVRYQRDDMECFLDGRYTYIRGENNTLEPVRAEGEITTGVRYLFDTDARWQPSGYIEGYVFNDTNGDGYRQEGEEGMPNMLIRINHSYETLTDESGFYSIPAVTGKNAMVVLDDKNIPTGFTPSTSTSKLVTIRHSLVSNADFGLSAQSYIFGYVFNDVNGDGYYGRGDIGIQDVDVILDKKIKTTTDARGRFQFIKMPVGSHRVGLDLNTLEMGYLPLKETTSEEIEIHRGVSYQYNFAVISERKVSGRVFLDVNDNRHYDTDDRPLANAVVNVGSRVVETDQEGYYFVDRIIPGSWTISVDQLSIGSYVGPEPETITFSDEPSDIKIDLPVKRR